MKTQITEALTNNDNKGTSLKQTKEKGDCSIINSISLPDVDPCTLFQIH